MENKTAMQEMLEWTRRTFPMDLDTPRMIEDKIESLMAKEKDQIIDAYWASYQEGQYSGDKTAEEYYNETYEK